MKDKTWSISYQGHHILVRNQLSIFPPRTREVLEIDGAIVKESGTYLSMAATLLHHFTSNDENFIVEARIGQIVGGFKTGCHILVNNQLLGGDTNKEINYPDPEKSEKVLRDGALRFIQRNFLKYGIPFAVIILLFNTVSYTTQQQLEGFLINLVVFGVFMSSVEWLSIRHSYRVRKKFQKAQK